MIILITLLVIVKTVFIEPSYPPWAHSHWVWMNGPNQNQSNLLEMIAKYQENNITIGALLVDSAWSTQFNNFRWNTTKFPDPQGMIDYLHSEGIRVIAWATSIINNGSSNYQYAKQKGYFLNNGSIIQWWHGTGSYLDYRNKQGVDWWHKQMDLVLDMGLDGWKTDRCDLFLNRLKPWPYSQKITNVISLRQYSNSYYRDFFYYTKTKNPNALIMSRPVDRQHGETIYRQFAPKDVVFAGWVGDQHSSYEGLQQALKNVFLSAWKGYLNFGFDIGGYSGQNFSKNGFIRFAQTGALLPLMQNGGHGRHCPWQFDDQTVQIYRKYVDLHLDLMPYFLTAGLQALKQKISVIQPLAKKQGKIAPLNPSNFGYLLWKDILVHSIFNDQGIANITFPKNSSWVYYFNHQKVFRNKQTILVQLDLDQSPIFLQLGSTIPFASKYTLVYPQSNNYSRTIINQNYTDYLSYSKIQTQLQIKIQRFYKQNYLFPTETSTNIQIIGAIKYSVDQKYSPKLKHNTLMFNLPFNTTLVIQQLVIGNTNQLVNELLTQ